MICASKGGYKREGEEAARSKRISERSGKLVTTPMMRWCETLRI
jgi:hypothetical protein